MSIEEINALKANENVTDAQKQKIDTYLEVRQVQEKLGITPEHVAKFQTFLDKWFLPHKDKIIKIASDESVTKALNEILDTGDFKLYIVLQVLLIFFMIFLRAKKASDVEGFLSWMWLNLWTLTVFMVFGTIIIPLICFGSAYKDLIWALIKAAQSV